MTTATELSALGLVEQAGVTYRQVDLWTTRGYLVAIPEAHPGTGKPRRFPETEVAVARLLAVISGWIGTGSPVTADDISAVAHLVRAGVRSRVVLTHGVLLDLEEICEDGAREVA